MTSTSKLWKSGVKFLPGWRPESEFDLQAPFSCRDAAIAAERLGEWIEAADWLADARARTGKGANPLYEAALLIDEGYARWKAGDLPAALSRLADGLAAIELLPPDDADERAYILRKRTGHTLMWVASITNGTSTGAFVEPPPACCSSLNPVSGPRERSTPHDIMWAHLAEFEFAADLGDKVLLQHESRLVASPYGLVRVSFGSVCVRHRLAHLKLDDLVEVAVALAEATEICRLYYRDGALDGAEPLPADAAMPTKSEAVGGSHPAGAAGRNVRINSAGSSDC